MNLKRNIFYRYDMTGLLQDFLLGHTIVDKISCTFRIRPENLPQILTKNFSLQNNSLLDIAEECKRGIKKWINIDRLEVMVGDQGDSEGMGELVNYSVLRKIFTFSSGMPLTHFFKLPPFTLFYYAIISASRFNLGLPILQRLCIPYQERSDMSKPLMVRLTYKPEVLTEVY